MATETGWVIEFGESEVSRPTYWIGVGVGTPFEWPFGSWTDDNLKAVRFSRKEDAQAVADSIYHFSGEDPCAACRVAEHMWTSDPTLTAPSPKPEDALREAAAAFLAKVDELEPAINSAIQMSALHGAPWKSGNWVKERVALRAALAKEGM